MIRPEPRTRFRIAALAALALAPIAATAQEAKPTASAFDLAMVPKDAPVVIAFRPAALLKRPDLKALYEEMTRPEEVRRVVDVAEPETIEQVTLVLLGRDIPAGRDPGEAMARSGAILVKTNKPREWKALAAAGGVPLAKASHAGKDYFLASTEVAHGLAIYQPDDKALVVAFEANLRKLIDGDKADAEAPARDLGKAAGEPIFLAAVDFAWVRRLIDPQIKADKQAAIGLSVVGPIWEETQRLVVAASVGDDGGLTLTADHSCTNEEGAARVARTVEALLTLARNVAPQALRAVREQAHDAPLAVDLASLGEQALKAASVDLEGDHVRLTLSAKADVAKIAREVMKRR